MKYTRIMLLALISLSILVGSSFAYDLLEYYPLTVGSHWEESNDDYVTVIEDYEDINGRPTIIMRCYSTDPFERDDDMILSYDSNYIYIEGVFEYDDDPDPGYGMYWYNPPLKIKRHLNIGETTSSSTTVSLPGGGTTPHSFTLRLVRIESVTVPAGFFQDCLVIEGLEDGELDTDWWARGVGYVKNCESYDDYECWLVGSYYIAPAQTSQDPVVSSFTSAPISGTAPLAVTFSCSASDPDGGEIAAYRWDVDNNGTVDASTTVGSFQYTYNSAGTYQATCTVVDDEGRTVASSPVMITVITPPQANELPIPSAPSIWAYSAVENPVASLTGAAACNPFAVGNVSSGILDLQVSLPEFSSGVDVYLAMQSNVLAGGALLLFDQNKNIQPVSAVLPPWKINTSAAINESLYGDIPTFFLPAGVYNLYTLVVPTGETNFSHYYLWATSFNINH